MTYERRGGGMGSGDGGAPSGSAGGDLAGTYPAPTVPGLTNKEDKANKGVAGGYAALNASGLVDASLLTLKGLVGELRHLPGGNATIPALPAFSSGRSIQSRDIVFAHTVYGTGSQPFDGSTQYANATYNPIVFINRSFIRLNDITSVAWYLDDTNLAAYNGTGTIPTPSTSPLTGIGTAAPWSVGGMDANLQMGQWDLTALGISSFGSAHTLSCLVTYDAGYQESVTVTFYPFNSAATLTLPATGVSSTQARGVFTGPTDTTTRAARAVLDANGGQCMIVGGSSWRGSNLTLKGQWRHFGKLEVRGNFYHFEGAGSPQGFECTFPPIVAYATTDGSETATRLVVNSFQGSGYAQGNTYRDMWVHDGISDALYTERCKDVLVERCRFDRVTDLAGAAHYDGWQMAGDCKATGSLTDYKGNSVAVLIRNCEWNHGSWIIKSDLGTCDAITVENSIVHDSNREGILVQDVNTMAAVTMHNVWTWGHAVADYSYQGTSVSVVADNFNYSNTHIGNTTVTGNAPAQPAGWTDIARPVIVNDQTKTTGNGRSVSLSKPAVSNIGYTLLAFVAVDDASKTVTPPAYFTQVYDSGSGSAPRVYVFSYDLAAGFQSGPYVFTVSGTANHVAWAESLHWARPTNPVEVIASTATAGSGVIASPAVSVTAKNRLVQHVYFVSGAASAGTWTRPNHWAGQINTASTAQASTTMSSYAVFQPWSTETPIGNHGAFSATYSQSGNGTGLSLVIAPQYEAPPDRVTIPGVQAADIPGRFSGLKSRTVEDAVVELNKAIGSGGIPLGTVTTKGDLVLGTGSATVARQAAGADRSVPIYDSSQSTGLRAGVAGSGLSSATAQAALTNTTTETVIVGPYTIPANTVYAGQTFRIVVWGNVDNIASGSCNLRVRIGGAGGTSYATLGITSGTAKTNQSFYGTYVVTFRSASSSTVPTAVGGQLSNATAGTTAPSGSSTASNINTTSSKDLVLTAQWTGADPGNVLRAEGGIIELVV